jgi:hypothetical protein
MDDDDDDQDARRTVPPTSRIGRGEPRRYRTATRLTARARFPRERRTLPIAELVGGFVRSYGLTDACRQHVVCLYWDEIAGPRIAPKTWPVRLTEGVLHVETESSSWVHELQFHKSKLVAQINAWVDANRIWLGPPPLVSDIRFELGMRKKSTPIVERDYVRRLQGRQLRRLWRPERNVATAASDVERDAILAETSRIADPDLRRIVESVRVGWNR